MKGESIVSRLIANSLLQGSSPWIEEPSTTVFNNVHQNSTMDREVWLHMRHCYRSYIYRCGTTSKMRYTFTGGIVFEVDLNEQYEHTAKRLMVKHRLRPRWTKEKLTLALSRAVAYLLQERRLYQDRERLYLRIEPQVKQIPEKQLDEMIAKAEKEGITAAYDAMGIESLDYWNKLFP